MPVGHHPGEGLRVQEGCPAGQPRQYVQLRPISPDEERVARFRHLAEPSGCLPAVLEQRQVAQGRRIAAPDRHMAGAEAHRRNDKRCSAHEDSPPARQQEPSSSCGDRHNRQQRQIVSREEARPRTHGYQADCKPNRHPPPENMRPGKEQRRSDNQRRVKSGPVQRAPDSLPEWMLYKGVTRIGNAPAPDRFLPSPRHEADGGRGCSKCCERALPSLRPPYQDHRQQQQSLGVGKQARGRDRACQPSSSGRQNHDR